MRFRSLVWEIPLPQAVDAAPVAESLMDDQAFAAFYERTARPLCAYLARVSGSATLADDLLQETYLRFLGATLREEGEVSQRRYLFRIASNLLRDHWRKPVHKALEDVPESALGVSEERGVERMESRTLLTAGLQRLRPRERQLLWLAYAECYSHKEIAAITGLGAASIRLLLFRARRKMASFLRKNGMEGLA